MNFSFLDERSIDNKLAAVDSCISRALSGETFSIPDRPGRDIRLLAQGEFPESIGLAQKRGVARVLHDLANIELQAMELAFRTLIEYPTAPREFRTDLAELAREEARHLKLCLNGLVSLGFKWGDWPIHLTLWESVTSEDSLLDRLVIVHLYLEGSGLDSGGALLNRLSGVTEYGVRAIVQEIVADEVGHVQFGLNWYRKVLGEQGLVFEKDFSSRLLSLLDRLPKRGAKIHPDWRTRAGFSVKDVEVLRQVHQLKIAGATGSGGPLNNSSSG